MVLARPIAGRHQSQKMTSPCDQCGGLIEFETEQNGIVAECPHCKSETELHGVIAAKPDMAGIVEIRLASGTEIDVKAIQLCPRNLVVTSNKKKGEAIHLSGGVSSGLIPFGSLEWVAEASMAIGLLDAILSRAGNSKALDLLSEASELERRYRAAARYIPVHRIQNIQQPAPQGWLGSDGGALFVHSGDHFVPVWTQADRAFLIRWESVEQYCYVQIST